MADPRDAACPGLASEARAETPSNHHDDNKATARARAWRASPSLAERLEAFPDARNNYVTVMPYGLTLAELRAEWRRCASAGWQAWELAKRFPVPQGVAR